MSCINRVKQSTYAAIKAEASALLALAAAGPLQIGMQQADNEHAAPAAASDHAVEAAGSPSHDTPASAPGPEHGMSTVPAAAADSQASQPAPDPTSSTAAAAPASSAPATVPSMGAKAGAEEKVQHGNMQGTATGGYSVGSGVCRARGEALMRRCAALEQWMDGLAYQRETLTKRTEELTEALDGEYEAANQVHMQVAQWQGVPQVNG